MELFQNSLSAVVPSDGLLCAVEYPTSQGRIDVIIKTLTISISLSAKLDGGADEALQQIVANNYTAPQVTPPSSVPHWRNFSTKTRGVEK